MSRKVVGASPQPVGALPRGMEWPAVVHERRGGARVLYSERLLEHFRNPRHAGVLEPPAVVIDAENAACGDWLRLSAVIEDGVVVRAAFQVKGCTASIACGSALAEWLHGRRLEELRAGGREAVRSAIQGAVGELPAASRHAAELCADGVEALLRAFSASG